MWLWRFLLRAFAGCLLLKVCLCSKTDSASGPVLGSLGGTLDESLEESFSCLRLDYSDFDDEADFRNDVLTEIRNQFDSAKAKYAGDDNLMATFGMLLNVKLRQLHLESNSMEKISQDLIRISRGLTLLLEADKNTTEFCTIPVTLPVTVPANMSSESELVSLASQEMERMNIDQTVSAFRKTFDPDKKRILRTGSFVFLMFSTTADVCVLTGWGPCIVLYVVGSGGLLVWFAQILRETFGSQTIQFLQTIDN
ncbi:hypothetical protein HG535_0B01730 [Zygotorulaspora mrakii]|uniref:Protein BIG1 n=1 Tax=Zygotorulaspora mrakii TaxID=42260 RepID=A0A7H9AXM1_ZYGMR|nr:uncharacterized protein HG535_0B01730 [Zygotorulaspora mrakii]QLG71135.1 hypothetical protein HG535_0B01730 [Zygotorulaspora mrakii]